MKGYSSAISSDNSSIKKHYEIMVCFTFKAMISNFVNKNEKRKTSMYGSENFFTNMYPKKKRNSLDITKLRYLMLRVIC